MTRDQSAAVIMAARQGIEDALSSSRSIRSDIRQLERSLCRFEQEQARILANLPGINLIETPEQAEAQGILIPDLWPEIKGGKP